MTQPNNPQRQIRLEVPTNLNATYSNAVIISQTHSEIIMDFLQVMPNDPRARVQSRVVMTPANAKAFMLALQENLTRFETKNGEIALPPRPVTLADQLFGAVKPDGDEGSTDVTGEDR